MRIPTIPAAGARTLVSHLEAGGWSRREASNLVALVHGLRPTASGWTTREIDSLRFLQAMVRSGRISR